MYPRMLYRYVWRRSGECERGRPSGTPSLGDRADEWVKWIVAEVVASGSPVGEPGIDEAYQRLLSEKGLGDKGFEPVLPHRRGMEPSHSVRPTWKCCLVTVTERGKIWSVGRLEFNRERADNELSLVLDARPRGV